MIFERDQNPLGSINLQSIAVTDSAHVGSNIVEKPLERYENVGPIDRMNI